MSNSKRKNNPEISNQFNRFKDLSLLALTSFLISIVYCCDFEDSEKPTNKQSDQENTNQAVPFEECKPDPRDLMLHYADKVTSGKKNKTTIDYRDAMTSIIFTPKAIEPTMGADHHLTV